MLEGEVETTNPVQYEDDGKATASTQKRHLRGWYL